MFAVERMNNLKFFPREKGERLEMFFSRSMAFDDEDVNDVAAAVRVSSAYRSVEIEFIEKLKSGDPDAFDLLITRYSADIYALLYRLTENADEASDLTQETFLSALKAIKWFRGDAELKTWLFRIAVNHSRNRFRWWKRRKRNNTVSLDAPLAGSETKLGDTLSDPSESPEDNAMQRERETALTKALIALPEIFRETVILCDIEGLSYEDISRTLNVNIGTVKSRIARGREELRRKLKDF